MITKVAAVIGQVALPFALARMVWNWLRLQLQVAPRAAAANDVVDGMTHFPLRFCIFA